MCRKRCGLVEPNPLFSDDDKDENPFEDFINRDLGMESVPPVGVAKPGDEGSSPFEPHDDDDDDDLSDTTNSGASRFHTGSGNSRVNPFGSSSSGERPPFGVSPFGRPPFTSGSSFSNKPPNSSQFRALGSAGGSSGYTSPFGRPQPATRPPIGATSFGQRARAEFLRRGLDDLVMLCMAIIIGLVALSTMLYVDNLRMSMAVRDGQIVELRAQVEDLQRQLDGTTQLENAAPAQ